MRQVSPMLSSVTRGAASMRRAFYEPSSPSLGTSSLASNDQPYPAAAAALDPERTTESLGYTWLTHWQLIEEDRQFRRLVLQSTRGRQIQRYQQLLDLLEGPTTPGSSTTTRSDGTTDGSSTNRVSISDSDEAEIRIVHGKLRVVANTPPTPPPTNLRVSTNYRSSSASSASTSASLPSSTFSGTTRDLDDEAVDDLTWLASHPEAEVADLSLDYDSSDRSSTTSTLNTRNQFNDARRNALTNNNKKDAPRELTNSQVPEWLTSSTAAAGDGNFLPSSSETNLPDAAAVLPGAVQLMLGNEVATVRPLWISVHTDEISGIAALYESVVPLDAHVIKCMSTKLTPFCSVSGLNFGALADLKYGSWANFFVGLVGDVAPEEADILWPNQVLHRDRVMYNVRDAGDMARFLADPRKEDIEEHAENLQRLAQERGYRRGWCWRMLVSRWGKSVVDQYNIDKEKSSV